MNPSSMLRAIAELAQAEAATWRHYEGIEATLALHPILSQGGDGRSNEVPDPVFAVYASHIDYLATVKKLETALHLLREVQERMTTVRRSDPETARAIDQAVKAALCDGSQDPHCTRNAVRVIRGRSLCWTCIVIERQQHREGAVS